MCGLISTAIHVFVFFQSIHLYIQWLSFSVGLYISSPFYVLLCLCLFFLLLCSLLPICTYYHLIQRCMYLLSILSYILYANLLLSLSFFYSALPFLPSSSKQIFEYSKLVDRLRCKAKAMYLLWFVSISSKYEVEWSCLAQIWCRWCRRRFNGGQAAPAAAAAADNDCGVVGGGDGGRIAAAAEAAAYAAAAVVLIATVFNNIKKVLLIIVCCCG